MAIAQWQYGFRGAVWGAGTDVIVDTITGLDMPPIRSADKARPQAHGDIPGVRTFASRQIVFALVIDHPSGHVQDLLDQLDAAFALNDPLSQQPEPFQFWHPPRPVLTAFVEPDGFTYTLDRMYYRQQVMAKVALRAADPLLYGDLQTVNVPMFQEAGGFTFPFTFPYVFSGAGAMGDTIAANAGTRATKPVVTINGYAEQPYIENVTTGERLALSLNLGATDTVVIDCAAKTVTLNGTASERGAVQQPGSSFFALQPGDNHLRLHSVGLGSGNAVVTWRPAYL